MPAEIGKRPSEKDPAAGRREQESGVHECEGGSAEESSSSDVPSAAPIARVATVRVAQRAALETSGPPTRGSLRNDVVIPKAAPVPVLGADPGAAGAGAPVDADDEITDLSRSAPVPLTTSVLPPAPAYRTSIRPSPTPELDPERILLLRARDALKRAEPAEALRAIASHATLYEAGRLAEHRDALRVFALAQIGRVDDARTAAEDFERRHPESELLASVRRAISLT